MVKCYAVEIEDARQLGLSGARFPPIQRNQRSFRDHHHSHHRLGLSLCTLLLPEKNENWSVSFNNVVGQSISSMRPSGLRSVYSNKQQFVASDASDDAVAGNFSTRQEEGIK